MYGDSNNPPEYIKYKWQGLLTKFHPTYKIELQHVEGGKLLGPNEEMFTLLIIRKTQGWFRYLIQSDSTAKILWIEEWEVDWQNDEEAYMLRYHTVGNGDDG